MDIGTARELLGLAPNAVSTYNVEPADPAEADAVAERIEQAVPGVRAQRISQFNLTVGSVMGRLDLFLLLAVALAVLVGGVGIANTMLMSTSERYVEFGVMRTNGWTRRNVLALVTTESALLGFLSGAARRGAGDGRGRHHQPLPRRVFARPEPLAGRREPRRCAGDRDAVGALPRVEGVADDPDGRDPAQRDVTSRSHAEGDESRRLEPPGDCLRRPAVMIEAVDVRKTFQSGDEVVEALRGVTFRVPAGSCTFIVGPSGSGKSTLLYLLGRSTRRRRGRSACPARTSRRCPRPIATITGGTGSGSSTSRST